jgi:hypothetical protein
MPRMRRLLSQGATYVEMSSRNTIQTATENNLSTTESVTTTEDDVNDSVYVKHCASRILLNKVCLIISPENSLVLRSLAHGTHHSVSAAFLVYSNL